MDDLSLTLPAPDAQRVLLVHAIEEDDRRGEVLGLDARREATREATEGRDDDEPRRWLPVRARRLVAGLTAEGAPPAGRVRRLLRFSDLGRGLVVPVVVLGLAAGLASNALGPERRVNLLAPPLLALVTWNLAIFALMGLRALAAAFVLRERRPPLVGWIEGRVRRWLGRDGDPGPAGPGGWSARYLERWLPAARPLAAARVRRALHLGAVATVAGVVAGMYLRGLALAYRATWESTFLGARQVEALLGVVLAPAAAVLGTAIPPVAPLEAPASGPAATWIHLWAATAALLVALPRLLLALAETARLWRARRRVGVTLPAGYVRRLLASTSAATPEVQVLPYSCRPTERAARALRGLLQDLAGARARVRVAPMAEYGAAPEPFEGGLRVVLFSLAQTPEAEVHGTLLGRLREGLADGRALAAVVDTGPYRRRLAEAGGGLEERLAERRRAWRRVVAEAGLEAVVVDLEAAAEGAAADAALEALGRAVEPAAAEGGPAWAR